MRRAVRTLLLLGAFSFLFVAVGLSKNFCASGRAGCLASVQVLPRRPEHQTGRQIGSGPPLPRPLSSSRHPLFAQIERDFHPFQAGGITPELVTQAYCQGTRGSFRLQVINGSAYVAGETTAYESRHISLKRQLLDLWLAGDVPEGIDAIIEQEDEPTVRPMTFGCPVRGPVLAPAKSSANTSHAHVILAPDHTFVGWAEAHTLPWSEQLALQQHAAAGRPWAARDDRLFFRGAATGSRNDTDPGLTDAYPELLDVRLVNWSSVEEQDQFVPLTQHCDYKYLLQLPGNSYAARLKYLLACGSAVVFPFNGYSEFWYHLLEDGRHVYLAEPVDETNAGHHLAEVAASLQANDAEAEGIGRAGAELAATALAPAMVREYWRRVLQTWRNLQTYNASWPHPDAVLLEQSVLVPTVINGTQRACPAACPAFNTTEYWAQPIVPEALKVQD